MAERLLEGRVAIVTGAGRSIGKAIARLMAEHGARVVVNDLGVAVDGSGPARGPADETAAEIREAGGEAVASYDSVAEHAGAGRIVQTALDSFGRLDILINPAGILRDRMVFNMSKEEWDDVIAVHLKGHFNLIQPASVIMRKQRSGRIITFSSTSGLWGNSGQANYGAAKDGVAGLTRVVARDLGRYGVTCNAITPSAETRMTQSVPEAAGEARARSGIAAAPAPLARPPEAVAPVAVWLASDEASNINGQVFYVSGGLIGLMSHPAAGRTITKPGDERWTVEELAAVFPTSLGMDLPNPAPARPE
ncbi:MAG: SDR family oxidoreductase [Chloroflexi bacterium]|nr:SDR family oxidoreductase [Chloroflexota bacterium]